MAPEDIEQLEDNLVETGLVESTQCAQFAQHKGFHLPRETLVHWGIWFTLLDPRCSEVVVTLARAYHQGFSTGYTLAEAIIHPDPAWTKKEYPACITQCTETPITKESMMLPNEQGEFEVNTASKSTTEDSDRSNSLSPKRSKFKKRKRRGLETLLPTSAPSSIMSRANPLRISFSFFSCCSRTGVSWPTRFEGCRNPDTAFRRTLGVPNPAKEAVDRQATTWSKYEYPALHTQADLMEDGSAAIRLREREVTNLGVTGRKIWEKDEVTPESVTRKSHLHRVIFII